MTNATRVACQNRPRFTATPSSASVQSRVRDADCDAALLDGHVCDLRTYEEAATGDAYEGLTEAQRSAVRGVCVHPSCATCRRSQRHQCDMVCI